MFKMVFLSFIYLHLALALASQGTIEFTGQGESVVNLSSTQSHTEYTYERVITTCSRQVPDGYERVCDKRIVEKRRICRMIDGRAVCTDEDSDSDDNDDDYSSHPHCYDRQTYRTEYYSCEEVISHPHSVFDFSTDGTVALKFSAWPSELTSASTRVTVNLSDAGFLSAQAETVSVTPIFIFGRWSDEVRQGYESSRKVAANLNISFQNAQKMLAPLKSDLSDIAINQKELSFLVTAGQKISDYELAIQAKKVRWFILKDRQILNKTLRLPQFKIVEEGNKWRVSIPLNALSKFEIDKKYRFEFNLELASEIKENLLNPQQLPAKKIAGKFKGKFQ